MTNLIENILNNFNNRIIQERIVPEREASSLPIPNKCESELKECLIHLGYQDLYSHQAEMFNAALDGKNIVITTGTSSGKSLSFYMPVIDSIIKNPSTRALFIYPTKALAQDQFKNLLPFLDYFGKGKIQAGVYDGDTPVSERKRIRQSANIIITNPDMLNSSFLPNHNRYGFDYLFRNLKFIILDELHAYRGAFGSHVSNVMRRLLRVCKYHHITPHFLCSSATIANPKELAENICHSKFIHIDKDGSPSSKKTILFWQPPFIGEDQTYRRSPTEEMTEIIPTFIENEIRLIAFCTSRKETEIVTKECRDTLSVGKNGHVLANKISGYRGGYTPKERHRIEKSLNDGSIVGVVATNALELGIDIGALDVVLMGGFPMTRASFWQQVGRAGRRGKESYAVLMLKNRAYDQYVGMNPDWLLENSPENAVIDKNNVYIQLSHIRAAAAELPLTIDDIAFFPDLGEVLPLLEEEGEVSEMHNNYHWSGSSSPAHEITLRNITNETIEIVNLKDSQTLTSVDISQAKNELYPGAIYMHDTILYKSLDLNLETRRASVEIVNSNYYTDPFGQTNVDVLVEHNDKTINRSSAYFGEIKITKFIIGYQMLQFNNHSNLGFENLETPLQEELETEGCWIVVPSNIINANIEKITQGMEYALRSSAGFRVMATMSDIASTSFKYIDATGEPKVAIVVYDKYIGGLGFSEKVFDNIQDVINDAILLVQNCQCKDGCPACVGDYKIDKKAVNWALMNLIKETKAPATGNNNANPKVAIIPLSFKWENLENEWFELVNDLKNKAIFGSDFLSLTQGIKITENNLVIYCLESHLRLVDKDDIKLSIKNAIARFVNVPYDLIISFEKLIKDDDNSYKKRILRHSET